MEPPARGGSPCLPVRKRIFNSGFWFYRRQGSDLQFEPLILGQVGPIHAAMDHRLRRFYRHYSFSPNLSEAPKSTSSLLGSGLSANHWECPWKVSQHKPRNQVCLHHIRPDLRGDGFLKRISSINYPAK